jgi:hypothetical protein
MDVLKTVSVKKGIATFKKVFVANSLEECVTAGAMRHWYRGKCPFSLLGADVVW